MDLERDETEMDTRSRSSNSGVFLRKGVLRICSKFTGAHSCISLISIKLLCNFIEIALWHGSSPVNLLHIFRIPFRKNTSARVLLTVMRAATKRNRFSKGISKKTYKYQRDLIAKKYKSSLPTHIWIKKIQNSDPPLTKPEKTHF